MGAGHTGVIEHHIGGRRPAQGVFPVGDGQLFPFRGLQVAPGLRRVFHPQQRAEHIDEHSQGQKGHDEADGIGVPRPCLGDALQKIEQWLKKQIDLIHKYYLLPGVGPVSGRPKLSQAVCVVRLIAPGLASQPRKGPGCNPGPVPQKKLVVCDPANKPPLCKEGWRLAPPGGLVASRHGQPVLPHPATEPRPVVRNPAKRVTAVRTPDPFPGCTGAGYL